MKNKKLFNALLTITLLLALVGVSFAWIPRNYSPELEHSDISISTEGALVISLRDDGSTTDSIDLNKELGLKGFTLKQVSSPNGVDFRSVDFTPILNDGKPIYNNEIKGKYIETEFFLKTQGNPDSPHKLIYLDPESNISLKGTNSVDTSYAIRISIGVEGINAKNPHILCRGRNIPDGDDLLYEDGLKAVDLNKTGGEVFNNYPSDMTLNPLTSTPQITSDIKRFMDPLKTDNNPSNDHYLFEMAPNDKKRVFVKIWLEGCDENCIQEIAGTSLMFKLKFAQVNKPAA